VGGVAVIVKSVAMAKRRSRRNIVVVENVTVGHSLFPVCRGYVSKVLNLTSNVHARPNSNNSNTGHGERRMVHN
jgi:hypothetical protein